MYLRCDNVSCEEPGVKKSRLAGAEVLLCPEHHRRFVAECLDYEDKIRSEGRELLRKVLGIPTRGGEVNDGT